MKRGLWIGSIAVAGVFAATFALAQATGSSGAGGAPGSMSQPGTAPGPRDGTLGTDDGAVPDGDAERGVGRPIPTPGERGTGSGPMGGTDRGTTPGANPAPGYPDTGSGGTGGGETGSGSRY